MNRLFLVGVAYGFVAVISFIRPVSFDNHSIPNFSHVCKFGIVNAIFPSHSAMHNSHHHYSKSSQWIIINTKNKCSSGMKFWYLRWLLTALYLSLSLQQRYLSFVQVISIPISIFFYLLFTSFDITVASIWIALSGDRKRFQFQLQCRFYISTYALILPPFLRFGELKKYISTLSMKTDDGKISNGHWWEIKWIWGCYQEASNVHLLMASASERTFKE